MTSAAERPRVPILARHSRARRLLPIFLIALVGLSAHRLCRAPDTAPQLRRFSGAVMGTTYQVTVADRDGGRTGRSDADAATDDRLARLVAARLERIDVLMSTYKPESEVSRLNRHDGSAPFPLSTETYAVLELAAGVSAATGGAFDVTIGPVVDAWGFGPAPPSGDAPGDARPAPPPEVLAAIADRVGHELLELEPDARTVRKRHPDVQTDLSAIAKGFGVDEVARALLAEGIGHFLVEVGGEVRAHGRPSGSRPWRVAIERPDVAARDVHLVVPLEDLAMATSGDYRNFYEREGRRFSHIIDPRTLRPVTHGLASVTVVDPMAARADAFATALSVLGPIEGLALAEREGLAAYFLERRPDGSLRSTASAAFGSLGAGS